MFGRRRVPSMPAVAAVSAPFGRDVGECLDAIERIVRRARERGAELVVFPESALGGYLYGPPLPCVRMPCPSARARPRRPRDRRLVRIAGPTVVCVGYTEDGARGSYSSAVCVSGDGILGHHRKVHLPPAERGAFAPGEGFAAFDTPVGRIGMLDLLRQGLPRVGAPAGAGRRRHRRLAGGVAGLAGRPGPANCAATCRCATSTCSTRRARSRTRSCGCPRTRCGRFGALRFPGQAKVVDPAGRVLAATGARPGLARGPRSTPPALRGRRA